MCLENYHSPGRASIVYQLLQFFSFYISRHFKCKAESRFVNQIFGKINKMMSIDRNSIMVNLI